ncbi:exodeoxyribonuclease VII large subunit [Leuconostocaceae bacterium ESL0958]|nr:exodeoxyribonuclease VII large subunit [Leuconostocaceae bacterium ESL0958]
MEQAQYLSVAALTGYLKAKFDRDPYLGKVYLTGEISNLGNRKGRHLYFSIKDPDQPAVIRAAFFSYQSRLSFEPKEGMKVFAVGHVQVYEPAGSYSIIIDEMKADGVGDLYLALTQLRARLQREGLFNFEKKTLPPFPKKIGVITSPTGAVIEDVAQTVARRFPTAQVLLLPAVVQGEQAVPSLLAQLDRVDELGFDALIIGRGGGSIEDLWAFNDEQLVRRVRQLATPVIASVGHETDNTLVDLVADRRAATPTAAAELATPITEAQLVDRLYEDRLRLVAALKRLLTNRQERLNQLLNRPILQQPDRLYTAYQQRVDYLEERLHKSFEQQVNRQQARFDQAFWQLVQARRTLLRPYQEQVSLLSTKLDLVSPLKILSAGYTLVRNEQGKLVKRRQDLTVGDQVELTFADGAVSAAITGEKNG